LEEWRCRDFIYPGWGKNGLDYWGNARRSVDSGAQRNMGVYDLAATTFG
jgi:hypothetical protein